MLRQNSMKLYNTLKNNRYSLGILASLGTTGFIFKENIYNYSHIAQKQDIALLQHIDIITDKITSHIIKNNPSFDTINFLLDIVKKEQTNENLVIFLLQTILKEPSVIKGLNDSIKDPVIIKSLHELFIAAFSDEEIFKETIVQTHNLLKDPKIQLVLQNMIIELLQREEIVKMGKEYLREMIQDGTIKNVINSCNNDILVSLCKDPNIQKSTAKLLFTGDMYKNLLSYIFSKN